MSTSVIDWEVLDTYEEGVDPVTGNYSKALIVDQLRYDVDKHREAFKEQQDQIEALLVGLEQDEYERVVDILEDINEKFWALDINEYVIGQYCHQELEKRKAE